MTEPKRRGRPPKAGGETPVRSARVGPVWDEAAEIAKARGENIAAVLDRLLTSYVRRHRQDAGAPSPGSDRA